MRHAVATLINGTKVGEVYEDQKSFDVVVRGTEELRHDLTALSELSIDLPLGGHVPLGELADLEIVPAPNEIKRESASSALRRDLQRAGPRLGLGRPRIESNVRAVSPMPGTTRVLGRIRRPAGIAQAAHAFGAGFLRRHSVVAARRLSLVRG